MSMNSFAKYPECNFPGGCLRGQRLLLSNFDQTSVGGGYDSTGPRFFELYFFSDGF